jgi:hypothetical protein
MPLPNDIDRHLTQDFRHNECMSACLNPVDCCFNINCAPCSIYTQRRRILDITGEPYIMCGGTCPCCGFEKPRPVCCLVWEAFCCTGAALAGNRFLVQTRFNRRNTSIQNCLSIFHVCVSLEFMCLRLCFDCSKERENLYKAGCCVGCCSHCQNVEAIDDFQKSGYIAPLPGLIRELPEHFGQVGFTLADAPAQVPLMR